MTDISAIEGIGAASAQKLKDAGVLTVEALLTQGATSKGREGLAQQTGISAAALLGWVNRADLFRIKGVGEEMSDLLEVAGVDTVPELARRNASSLLQRMTELNEQRKLVRRLPTQAQVEAWIEEAKQLPRIVEH
jgi:predicted flap endonuclease-1-like 5' DNA nuclease